MILLAIPLALVLPTLFGWLVLRLLEGKHPVLFTPERWVMGGMLGLTLILFVQFLLQITFSVPFSLLALLATQGICTALLGTVWYYRRASLPPSPALPPSSKLSQRMAILLGALLSWAAIKSLFVGTIFLILVPSYLQDTLSNWNLRGKVMYHTQELTLVMPNEDPIASPKGVSSYPPSVPMAKVLVANVAGVWNDSLVNGLHAFWYLGIIALLYFALRRYVSNGWSLFGVYVLMSLPLYVMHNTNAYGDAFLSVHVFCAVSVLLHACMAKDGQQSASFLRIASLAGALLVFTKNEGMLVFLPPFVLCMLLTVWTLRRTQSFTMQQIFTSLAGMGVAILCIAGPFLLFKWMNGLTFGNAKPFTSLAFGWQEHVLQAVAVNTFFEGNWLLLFPLFFGLIIAKWRTAFSWLLVPMCYFLLVYVGQVFLYLFTGLSREALMQTGYARGLIQLMPLTVMLTMLLLYDVKGKVVEGLNALRNGKLKINN